MWPVAQAEHSDTLYQVPWMETLLLRAAKSTKGSQDALSKATRLGQALLKTDRWDYPSVFPMICSVAKASSGMYALRLHPCSCSRAPQRTHPGPQAIWILLGGEKFMGWFGSVLGYFRVRAS